MRKGSTSPMHSPIYPVATALAILAILAMLVAPSVASAWTTIDGVADPLTAKRYRDWQAAAQIPTPHITVNIQERDCTEAGSIACLLRFTARRMTLVYADPSWLWREDTTPERITDRLSAQSTFYHELTHIRDYQPRRTHRYRDRFARIMGWRPLSSLSRAERARYDEQGAIGVYQGWDGCVYLTMDDCADPGELFAMAGQWCSLNARNRTRDEWAAGYGYAPTLAQHRAACAMLAKPLG